MVEVVEKYKEGYCDNEYIRRFFKSLDRDLNIIWKAVLSDM